MTAKPTIARQAVRQRAAEAATTEAAMNDAVADGNVAALDAALTELRKPAREAVLDEPLPPGAVVGRNGEVLSRKRTNTTDIFYVPEHLKEPGWSYEWKTETVLGEQRIAHQVMLAENGWRAVQAEGRWAGVYMPNGYTGPIRRDGLVLMERPISLTNEAYAEERRNAANQMRNTKESLRLAMPSGFTQDHAGAQLNVKQTYELGPAPASSKRSMVPD